jgi:hypothetical protein
MSIESERLARTALRWDAAYCTVVGVAVAAFASAIAYHIDVDGWIVATIGVAAVIWAGVLGRLGRQEDWRQAAVVAASANGIAALAVGYWAYSLGGPGGIVLGLFALQILGFGAAQVWAWVRSGEDLRSSEPGSESSISN